MKPIYNIFKNQIQHSTTRSPLSIPEYWVVLLHAITSKSDMIQCNYSKHTMGVSIKTFRALYNSVSMTIITRLKYIL